MAAGVHHRVTVTDLPFATTPLCATGQEGTPLPNVTGPGQPLSHKSHWGWCWLLPYLYSLAEAFQGVDIQPFLAGLQAGNHLLTLHPPRADGKAGQAAVEELGKPRFGDFSACKSGSTVICPVEVRHETPLRGTIWLWSQGHGDLVP